jgi:hypothetical protein
MNYYSKYLKYSNKFYQYGGRLVTPEGLPESWRSKWETLTEDQKLKVAQIFYRGLDFLIHLSLENDAEGRNFEAQYERLRNNDIYTIENRRAHSWELDEYALEDAPEGAPENELVSFDQIRDRLDADAIARRRQEALENERRAREADLEANRRAHEAHLELMRQEEQREQREEQQEQRYREYAHLINPEQWREIAHSFFEDIALNKLYEDPYIGSDGATYSRETLASMFAHSANPRGKRGLNLVRINDQIGIQNVELRILLDKFKEGKLKISKN